MINSLVWSYMQWWIDRRHKREWELDIREETHYLESVQIIFIISKRIDLEENVGNDDEFESKSKSQLY